MNISIFIYELNSTKNIYKLVDMVCIRNCQQFNQTIRSIILYIYDNIELLGNVKFKIKHHYNLRKYL